MSPAVAAILEGMPEPLDLRLHREAGRHVIMVGSQVLFDYDAADVAMRNLALATLRRLGFPGRRVAQVLGLTENYVATLYSAALRQGSAALTGPGRRGRPGKLTDADWARAAPGPARAAGLLAAGARIIGGQVTSRYAGAMLLHAFGARAGAGQILSAGTDGNGRRFAD